MPYCRLPPYVVGMLIGYTLQHPDMKINLKPIYICCCWIASTIICLAIVLGGADLLSIGSPSTVKLVMSYALAPFAWSVCLAWITVACVYDYGGIVKRFLGWSFWAPWARLSYCMYLLHPVVIFRFTGTRQNKYHLDNLSFGYMYLSMLMMTILTAIPLSLAFESPMIGLEKLIFTQKKKTEEQCNNLTRTTPFSTSIGKSNKDDIEVTVEARNI